MRPPVVPLALGIAGLVPFVASAIATTLLPAYYVPIASYGAFVYGLVILAFLGGVHWGRALETGESGAFAWAVIPGLLAFFAAWMHRPIALAILAAAFLVAGVYDVVSFRRTGPAWYAAMRLWLTIIVAACLAIVAIRSNRVLVDPFGYLSPPG